MLGYVPGMPGTFLICGKVVHFCRKLTWRRKRREKRRTSDANIASLCAIICHLVSWTSLKWKGLSPSSVCKLLSSEREREPPPFGLVTSSILNAKVQVRKASYLSGLSVNCSLLRVKENPSSPGPPCHLICCDGDPSSLFCHFICLYVYLFVILSVSMFVCFLVPSFVHLLRGREIPHPSFVTSFLGSVTIQWGGKPIIFLPFDISQWQFSFHSLMIYFLATLVALHFTLMSEWVAVSD